MTAKPFRTRLSQIVHDEGRYQSWLARRSGVNAAELNRYIHGLHVPERHRAAIAEPLGRSVDELFTDDGSHLPPLERVEQA